jgi:hypothetical protein
MESGSNFVFALLDSVDQSGTPTASNATRAKVREIVAKRRRAQQAPESVIAPDSPPEELLHDPNWPDDCGEPKLPEVPYHTAQNLPMRETTILMIAFMGMIGLEDCPFRTMVELETAKRKFIDAFKNLARWNETNSSKQVSVEDQANISKTFVSGVAENTFRLFHQVTSLRGGVFSLFSPLRAYVAKISPSTDLVQKLSHFMILYSINLVLWELQNDQATRTTFINKILNDVYSATIPGTSQSSLKTNTVALMVFYRSAEVAETNGLKDGLWRLLKVLDVLRIMQLVSAPTWHRLTGLMSNWLTGECCAQQTSMHRMDGSNCLIDYLTE